MTADIMIIIFLLAAILCAIAIIGNNNDHYSGTSVSSDDFMRLYEQLGKPPVFRKKLFFKTFLVIIHEGVFIGTLEKRVSKEDVEMINPFGCK